MPKSVKAAWRKENTPKRGRGRKAAARSNGKGWWRLAPKTALAVAKLRGNTPTRGLSSWMDTMPQRTGMKATSHQALMVRSPLYGRSPLWHRTLIAMRRQWHRGKSGCVVWMAPLPMRSQLVMPCLVNMVRRIVQMSPVIPKTARV